MTEMKSNIIRVEKYCSEINWDEVLKPDVINLVVAGTGSGKTAALINNAPRDKNVAVLAPFVSLMSQILLSNPDYQIQKGKKELEEVNFNNGIIASFHSIPRLLEMKNIDLLVIDEIHYLVNYASFTSGMLRIFWETFDKLKLKFPHMKVVALTATPHFIRLATFLDFNLIIVQQKTPTSKPKEIFVSRSWTKEYAKDNTFLALYPSRKMGLSWAHKYGGLYIDSKSKENSVDYYEIVEGRMPRKKIFTSTILSTGMSIIEPVDIVYTNWLNLTDIVQISSRPRLGGHDLKVTQTANPFFLKDGMDRPKLNFGLDFEKNFKLLNDYTTYISWVAHQDENDLFSLIYEMLWLPQNPLPNFL